LDCFCLLALIEAPTSLPPVLWLTWLLSRTGLGMADELAEGFGVYCIPPRLLARLGVFRAGPGLVDMTKSLISYVLGIGCFSARLRDPVDVDLGLSPLGCALAVSCRQIEFLGVGVGVRCGVVEREARRRSQWHFA